MNTRIRWQQAEGFKHAVKLVNALRPHPGETFTALCGISATPQREDYIELAEYRAGITCPQCHTTWATMIKRRQVTNTGELIY